MTGEEGEVGRTGSGEQTQGEGSQSRKSTTQQPEGWSAPGPLWAVGTVGSKQVKSSALTMCMF